VVCLAPRARKDSVRPRRSSGVVVRPLNFTVRRREELLVLTLAWILSSVVPFALLAVAGFLLWRRNHSVAAAVVAVGFAVSLLAQVVGYLVEFNTSIMTRAYKDDGSFTLVPAHTFPHLAHYSSLVGFWVGALGLVWLATSISPSPNNRRRGP
jgi:hypothetical protein